MGHIDVEIWHRWVPPVNRRGRSTLGLDDSVRVSERDRVCENGPLSILRHRAQFFLLLPGWDLVHRGCAAHQTAIRQSNGERTGQSSPVQNQGRFSKGGDQKRVTAFRPSRGRALAQTLGARSGPVPELLPQPESVNMILLLSRAETLAMTLGREGLIWAGDVGQLWRPEPPDHETQAMQRPPGRRPPTARQTDSIAGEKECRNAGNESTRRPC